MNSKYKTDEEKISFCLGLDLASRVVGMGYDINVSAFMDAINTVLSRQKPDITQEEFEKCMGKFYKLMDEKKSAGNVTAAKAKEDGDNFRKDFAKNPAVKTTASGLMAEILVEGSGKQPGPTSKVKVHYEGTLINGKVFDSSYKRNEPITFPLNQVIKGWQEGLQLIKVGGKIKLVIPPELAYGERGAGADIPPNSTLIFVVELLDIC